MPLKHVNYKDITYFLHSKISKSGKPKYYFSTKKDGILLNQLPSGYEIHENPNGMVYLRKIQPRIISNKEESIVETGMINFSIYKNFKIQVKKNIIIIYSPDQNIDELSSILNIFYKYKKEKLETIIQKHLHYSPTLQFMLIDSDKRIFQTKRFCYLDSIDDWIDIGKPGKLSKLVKTYVKHLGEDSYFELF